MRQLRTSELADFRHQRNSAYGHAAARNSQLYRAETSHPASFSGRSGAPDLRDEVGRVSLRKLNQSRCRCGVYHLINLRQFGTIVGVENRIRALLHDDTFSSKPIQFLVLDLSKVDGVDFSAAEAFTRINRILSVRDVQMIMCGIAPQGDVWKSLFNVGLLSENDGVLFFEDLNAALENCENQLLKAFYQRKDDMVKMGSGQKYLGEHIYL